MSHVAEVCEKTQDITQKNGAVSKVIKGSSSLYTLSAARTVQISHSLREFCFNACCGAERKVSKMASQQEKACCVVVLRCPDL
jgi:hypothetical protein